MRGLDRKHGSEFNSVPENTGRSGGGGVSRRKLQSSKQHFDTPMYPLGKVSRLPRKIYKQLNCY